MNKFKLSEDGSSIEATTALSDEKEVQCESVEKIDDLEYSAPELLPDATDLIAVILNSNLKPAYAEEILMKANHQLWKAAALFNQMLDDLPYRLVLNDSRLR